MAENGEKMPARIGMTTFSLPAGARVKMLGSETNLKWDKTETGFSVTIPEKIRNAPPSKYVWVAKVTF
jgi:alpha-L-fucosidase